MSIPFDPRIFQQAGTVPQAYRSLFELPYLEQPLQRVWYVGPAAGSLAEWQSHWPGKHFIHQTTAHTELSRLSAEELPEAIVCDTQTVDGSPLTWARLLQADARLAQLPLVLVGAAETWPVCSEAQQAGVDDCFVPDTPPHQVEARLCFLKQHKADLAALRPAQASALKLYHRPWAKRVFDLGVASLLMLLLAPVLLLIWISLRVGSKQAPLVKLPRIGTGYQQIHCLAFCGTLTQPDGQTAPNWWGRRRNAHFWLHLPRLINVLRGDLSIVGNRPIPVQEAEQLTTDEWGGRFLAPVGITGPWRLAIDAKQQREMEVNYARNNSLLGDIVIALRTAGAWRRPGGSDT